MMENLIVNDTRPPIIYRIERDGETGAVSVAVGNKERAGVHWHRLPHCNLHSPSGFEVGYCGSGPADTAASILADYFGEEYLLAIVLPLLSCGADSQRMRAMRPWVGKRLNCRAS